MSSAEVNQKFHASWRHPFQNAQIYMDALPFRGLTTRALRFSDRTEPTEIGGLLWGKAISAGDGQTIIIQQAEFIGADGPLFNTTDSCLEHLSAALARPRTGLEPIGYFRSAIRGDLFPREQDRAFVESKLVRSDSFALIVEPLLTGSCTAHFYFLQHGHLQMQSSLLRVPLVPQSLITDEEAPERPRIPLPRDGGLGSLDQAISPPVEPRQRPPRTEMILPESDHVTVSSGDEFPAHSSWTVGRSLFVAALLLAILGVSLYRILSPRLHAPAVMGTKAPETPIGLQVERRPDGQLDVNWNRNFARIAGRDGARLSIIDGSYVRTLELSQDQLLSGKLAYFPRSDDIRFRLEISVDGNRTVGESIRVVSPEVYASTLPPAASPQNLEERARMSLPTRPQEQTRARVMKVDTASGPAVAGRGGIVKTATPGTFILSAKKPSPTGGGVPAMTGVPLQDVAVPKRVPEAIITATPPPINTAQVKGSLNPRLVARIATPQSLSLSPPPTPPPAVEPKLVPTDVTHAARAIKPSPVTEMPKPVYQVMPNTKPFGYSLINNDVQVDIEVHIDESGVVREATPVAGRSGRSTLLTTQALVAARKWRFKPAEVDGRRVPCTYVISFKFRKA